MERHEHRGGLAVRRSDLSGLALDDEDPFGTTITNTDRSHLAVAGVSLAGLHPTVAGIAVPDRLAAWRAHSP